jgi:PIN domain nuclease of toxin-antitoxin system
MRMLIDTQIALWLISGLPYLKQETLNLLSDPANDVFMSVAAPWETTIKFARGKITVHGQKLLAFAKSSNIQILPVGMEHVLKLQALPLIHNDPFDRIMIAQAICDDLLFVTADKDVRKYALTENALGFRLETVVRQAVKY